MKKKRLNVKSQQTQKLLLKILGCLVIIVALLGGYTYSRYANDLNSEKMMGAPDDFFFESDFLTVNGTKHQLQNWNKEKDYNFAIDIRNFQDTLRSSAMDITYRLEISDLNSNVKATLGSDPINDSNTTFTLKANTTNTNQLLITVPQGKVPINNTISIKAIAEPKNGGNGFKKEISATFELVENTSTFDIQLENHSDYYDLLIGVAKSNQNITVTWPSWLTPDNTVNELQNATDTTITYTTTTNDSSVRLRFFVTGTVNREDIITVSDGSLGNDHNKSIAIKDAR